MTSILDDASQLISVRIGEQEFAIDIMSVREIRGWTASTPLPHAPHYVRGMINLRGAVLPVVDLGERLGLARTEPDKSSVIVVAQIGARMIGLLVDAVCDILAAGDGQLQPPPEVGGEDTRDFVRGVMILDGRIISLISLDAILTDELEPAA